VEYEGKKSTIRLDLNRAKILKERQFKPEEFDKSLITLCSSKEKQPVKLVHEGSSASRPSWAIQKPRSEHRRVANSEKIYNIMVFTSS
jgi:hypothetical protein